MFQPIALETLGPISELAVQIVLKRSEPQNHFVSADDKEGQFLFQRFSISLCRDSTLSCCTSRLGMMTARTFSRPAFLICLVFNHQDLYYRGYTKK